MSLTAILEVSWARYLLDLGVSLWFLLFAQETLFGVHAPVSFLIADSKVADFLALKIPVCANKNVPHTGGADRPPNHPPPRTAFGGTGGL